MTYTEAKSYLYSLERRGVRLGLDRILGAFREQGDPQESFPAVLVAGTNGKGSTTAFIASCLNAAGARTGLYTSPHLIDFRERMRVDGVMILPEEVADLTERLRGSIERWELSFFEATTLLAFVWFRERDVQAAAVEVGLGGRLDATRPVRTVVDVVTTIGLDHEKILGGTREKIAAEKAAILRDGVPAAVGVSAAGAVAVLRARAEQVRAPLYERRRCLRVSGIETTAAGSRFLVAGRGGGPWSERPIPLEIPLPGRHQVANAALAVLALSLMPERLAVDEEAMSAGMRRARWPGRCETLGGPRPVICDVAHNPDGARTLARTLVDRSLDPVHLIVGMVEGKDHAGFLAALAGAVERVYACSPSTDRAAPGGELARIAADLGLRVSEHGSPGEAIDAARAAAPPDRTILVAGSFFTVGEVMEHLGIAPPDPLWEPAGGPGAS